MIEIKNKADCCGCSACANICAHKAITMVADEKGFLYPHLDEDKCKSCGLCLKVCPIQNTPIVCKGQRKMLVAYNKDEKIRKKSTSGGLFTILANSVYQNGGVVCAARFDDMFSVEHYCSLSPTDIEQFRGSKYLQSRIGNTYSEIRHFLKEGIPVLFIGLPCQVAGLRKFLNKEYENLLTVDMVCMGVGSPKVWDAYLNKYINKDKIRRIVFKDKIKGWHNWLFKIEKMDGTIYEKGVDNAYFNGYLKHLFYRESCHSCHFKGIERCSDLTIADGWGIDKLHPEFDDNRGCSTVILQSEKGIKSWEEIVKPNVRYVDFDKTLFVTYNPYSVKCAEKNPFTKPFFKMFNDGEIKKAFDKYSGKYTFIQKIIYKLYLRFN